MPAPLAPVVGTAVSTAGRVALSRWVASVFGTGFTVSSTVGLLSGTGVWAHLPSIHRGPPNVSSEFIIQEDMYTLEPEEVVQLDADHPEDILDLLALAKSSNEYRFR